MKARPEKGPRNQMSPEVERLISAHQSLRLRPKLISRFGGRDRTFRLKCLSRAGGHLSEPMLKRPILLIGALLCGTLFMSCATRVGYRAHDREYSDYHVWSPQEAGYYNQWIVETHRHHKDYRRLRRREQRQYWQWRHRHGNRRWRPTAARTYLAFLQQHFESVGSLFGSSLRTPAKRAREDLDLQQRDGG